MVRSANRRSGRPGGQFHRRVAGQPFDRQYLHAHTVNGNRASHADRWRCRAMVHGIVPSGIEHQLRPDVFVGLSVWWWINRLHGSGNQHDGPFPRRPDLFHALDRVRPGDPYELRYLMFWAGQMAGIASGTAGFAVDAADFDGTNDYMLRGAAFTGIASSSKGIFYCWIRFDGGDAAEQTLLTDADTLCLIRKTTANKVEITLWDTGSSNLLAFNSSAITAGATWRHILASWDTGFSSGNKLHHLYITNTSDKVVSVDSANGGNVNLGATNWGVGARTDASLKINAALAEFYFAPGQYLDFSTSANRAKFISGGKPVNLGGTGSVPTGTSPIAYFRLLNGDAATRFATNLGTGGNMTITGTLDIASSSPSD